MLISMGKLHIHSSACIPRGLALLVYSSHYFHFPVASNFVVITLAQTFSCLSSASSVLCALNLTTFLPFRSSFVQPASSKSPPHPRQNRDPPSLHLLHLAAILPTSVGLCSTTKTDRSLIAKQLLIKLHIENCSFKWSLLSHCYFATQSVTLFTTMPHKLLGQRCQQFLSVISIQVQQGIYLLGAQALRGDT